MPGTQCPTPPNCSSIPLPLLSERSVAPPVESSGEEQNGISRQTIYIVQGIGPDSWRWTVHLDEKTIKSGQATSRSAAMTSVVWLIDKALEPKRVTPDAPSGELF
jgi:hypothetical protein